MSDAADIASKPPPGSRDVAPRGGRPTKAAAAARDERLLEIATRMFLEQGFEATSMDGLAEAAAIGKATLYARYADKGALFAAILRRRILQVYAPIEKELKHALDRSDLQTALTRLARLLMEKSLSPDALALGRILSAQGHRFPELVQLAVKEGTGRQLRLVETVLAHFEQRHAFAMTDLTLAADLFLSIVIGRATRLAIFGVALDAASLQTRTEAAVKLFVRGLLA